MANSLFRRTFFSTKTASSWRKIDVGSRNSRLWLRIFPFIVAFLTSVAPIVGQIPDSPQTVRMEKQTSRYQKIFTETPLPGTALLQEKGPFPEFLLDQADQFLDRELAHTAEIRTKRWTSHRQASFSSDELQKKRLRLAYLLGVRDERTPFDAPELRATLNHSAEIAQKDQFQILAIRWPVFERYSAEGILVEPAGNGPVEKTVIAIPHAGIPALDYFSSSSYLRRLAESGSVRILLPEILHREVATVNTVRLPAREIVFRGAFLFGRTMVGNDVQTILALVDWLGRDSRSKKSPTIVGGYGDGAMIALNAAALDQRIDEVHLAGYFGNRANSWREPIDRTVFDALNEFGDAETAALVAPRTLVIETAAGPNETLVPEKFEQGSSYVDESGLYQRFFPSDRWSPGKIVPPTPEEITTEIARTRTLTESLSCPDDWPTFVSSPAEERNESFVLPSSWTVDKNSSSFAEYQAVQRRILRQLVEVNQTLLRHSAEERKTFWAKLDTSTPEKFTETVRWYRDYFSQNIAGEFDRVFLPPNPRTRLVFDAADLTGYEVLLDVFDGLSAEGILFLLKGFQKEKKYPVVVFQHGREGTPESSLLPPYGDIVSKLIAEGYLVFCPQNLYILGDRYRILQRKCWSVGKTFYAIINAQHRQIVRWLQSLESVDPAKIGFYGLSYGGKSAMFIPSVVTDYAVSICSGDFNERAVKCADVSLAYGFLPSPEYEMFEFNAGNTFNYAEIARLIAPRPFMVERGYRDGVGTDELVQYEYAKVRRFYDLDLGLANRTTEESFAGVHEIHAVGTLEFLARFLKNSEK